MALAQFPPDWIGVVKVAVVFVIGHALEGNLLSPKLVGDRVGLHPVWIMFALLAGGSLFGFIGVLIAVPVAAVIGVVVRHLLGRYRASTLLSWRRGRLSRWSSSSRSTWRCRRRPLRARTSSSPTAIARRWPGSTAGPTGPRRRWR